jgi:hypothetical protein
MNIEEEEERNKYSHLKDQTIVGVDPGKHSIIYLTSDDVIKPTGKNRMQISNVERRQAIKAKLFRFLQLKRKKKKKHEQVIESETLLSTSSSKGTSVKAFQEYLTIWFEIQKRLYEYYSNFLFRIHRWNKYKREKRFQVHVVKQIETKFGKVMYISGINCKVIFIKNCVLAYGMWNRKTQMRGLIPSPTCGLRRALSKHFTIIDTPEPNTTKTCSKCLEGEMKEVKKRPHPNPKKIKEDPNCKLDVRGLCCCSNVSCQVFIN